MKSRACANQDFHSNVDRRPRWRTTTRFVIQKDSKNDSSKRIPCQIWQPSSCQQKYRQEDTTGNVFCYIFSLEIAFKVFCLHEISKNFLEILKKSFLKSDRFCENKKSKSFNWFLIIITHLWTIAIYWHPSKSLYGRCIINRYPNLFHHF